jgi:hypothetical protein
MAGSERSGWVEKQQAIRRTQVASAGWLMDWTGPGPDQLIRSLTITANPSPTSVKP